MNIFKLLFGSDRKKQPPAPPKPKTALEEHEERFVRRVISLLQNNPDDWSAIWSNPKSINKSIRHISGILIYLDGTILQPTEINPPTQQKEIILKITSEIITRDSIKLLERYK